LSDFETVIIGGGIIGTATAMALSKTAGDSLAVVEAEEKLASHQSGRNSGVIHSGIYYKPGTLKARLCVTGREALYKFLGENEIRHERCGKIIVAVKADELDYLEELEKRGKANGMEGIQRLDRGQIREHEPYASGIAGLFIPQTGIVNYIDVVERFAEIIRENGSQIITGARITNIIRKSDHLLLITGKDQIRARHIINCAGLYSDRVAGMCGLNPGLQIIPFRGEYYAIKPERRKLVRNLIYPVPDPRFPFLGVHFTRCIDGQVEAGPNAVLALSRKAYRKSEFSLLELANMALYRGFWKMARRYWKVGLGEFRRSLNKSAFTHELQKLLPDLTEDDLLPGGSGIRAQALEPDGSLVDDFRIIENESMIHVLNAPSPAATASLSIGEDIAKMAAKNFDLK